MRRLRQNRQMRQRVLTAAGLGLLLFLCVALYRPKIMIGSPDGESISPVCAFDRRPVAMEEEKTQGRNAGVSLIAPGYHLAGTLVSGASLACICRDDSGSCRLYKVNDSLSGAKIVSILPGRVTLQKDGGWQELVLLGNSRFGRNFRRDYAAAVLPSRQPVIREMNIDREALRREAGNITGLLRQVTIEPIHGEDNDKLKGYRISRIPEGSIFDQAGVENGDIIVSVAGFPLESAKDVVRILQTVRSYSNIEVGVVRDQQVVMLKYELAD